MAKKTMTDHPFDQPAPTAVIDRIHEFARDLAYGVANGWWGSQVYVTHYGSGLKEWYADHTIDDTEERFDALFEKKWASNPPDEDLLVTFGYFTQHSPERFGITTRAFDLLNKPHRPPDVFISYKRDQSSTFGLLIEARLKIAGNPNPFIDKLILAGEEWSQRLEDAIKTSRYFVCLVGPRTLESKVVHQEIEWAEKSGCIIISMWHGGAKMDANTPPALSKRHAIMVTGESAREYETAVNELLNSLGYSTY